MSKKASDKLIDYLMDRTDKVGEYIDKLAQKLGVAAEHVYGVMVKQQYAESVGLFIENGIWIFLWIAITIVLFVLWKKLLASGDFPEDIGIPFLFITFIVGVLFLFCVGDIVGDLKLATQMWINPEYYALEDIMEFVKGAAKDE